MIHPLIGLATRTARGLFTWRPCVHATEDKSYWCKAYGPDVEKPFAQSLERFGLVGALNPLKESDPFSHDLVVNFPSDLKTVRTPLFKAQELYGIDPQFAVTFNRKDMRRYMQLYPNIVVFFDVQWISCQASFGGKTHYVQDMRLLASGFLTDIQRAIVADGLQMHTYQRRVNDTNGNAKESWVFDIRRLHQIYRGVAQ